MMYVYLILSMIVAVKMIKAQKATEEDLAIIPVGDLYLYKERDYTVMYILFPIGWMIVSAYKLVCRAINTLI